jgi:hypothetical protein
MNKQNNSNESAPFDAIEIDRLVDGELTESEQRELLRRLEDQPAGWRQCALAFVESQVWSADLQRMTAEGQFLGDAMNENAAVAPPVTPRPVPLPGRVAFHWLATAATVMVAFVLGQQMDRGAPTPVTVSPASVADHGRSELGVALSDATERWLAETRVPVEIEQAIEGLGAEIQQEQGYYVRRRANGQQYVVPFRDVQIVPVRAPAFK